MRVPFSERFARSCPLVVWLNRGVAVAPRTCLDCSMVVKLKCWMNRGRNVRVFSAKSAKTLSGLLMRWWLKLLYGEEPLS